MPELTTISSISFSGRTADDLSESLPSALLARARRGDLDAFEELVEIHQRRVVGTAWRLLGRLEDAQDASQEVFLRMHRCLDVLDVRRPLAAWLYRVTVNVCHDLARKRRRRIKAWPLDDLPESRQPVAEGADSNPLARLSVEQETRLAQRGLATLSRKERAALVLRDLEGLSTREVAEVLGSSEGTVRSQICKARLKMKTFREHARARRNG